MRYSLASLWRRSRKPRRRSTTLRPIVLPAALASDLYAVGYAPIIRAWSATTAELLPIYERTLADLTQDSPTDVGSLLGGVESEIARLMLTIRLRVEQWSTRVERVQRTKWRSAVLNATGVDINTMVGAGDMRVPMSAAVERNVGLIKSVSEQARTRIGEAVFQGLQRRAPAREVAVKIREAVDMSRRRALNIASDQTVKLAATLNSERRREAGIDTWEWVSSHKVHFRPEHAARDGKRYSDDDAPEDLPGELPYCGCTERAVLSLDSEF